MKTKIFVTVLFILVFSALFLNKSANAQDLPHFNVKVLQHMSTEPAKDVLVIYKLNGIRVNEDRTDGNGMVYWTAASGTYDIYAYYPDPPPNDGQSAQKLGHVHSNPETVTLQLGPNY